MEDYKTFLLESIADLETSDKQRLLEVDEIERRDMLEADYDIAGNMTGSHTCNSYVSEQNLYKSRILFDSDFIDYVKMLEVDYGELIGRGAEAIEVVACNYVFSIISDDEIERALRAE